MSCRWLYTPRGCAVFHVPARNQHLIHTSLPTSHGYSFSSENPDTNGKTPFVHLFEFVATIDYTPYFCVPASIAFRKEVCGGEAAVRRYCWEIARIGGDRVAEILGTEVMDNETHTLRNCCFANVRLPLKFKDDVEILGQKKFRSDEASRIQKWLLSTAVNEFDTYLQIAFVSGAMWVRLSGQIYLEFRDFEWIGFRLKEMCERLQDGALQI